MEGKIALAQMWVNNRPHMSVEVLSIGRVEHNGHRAEKYRVTLYCKVRDKLVPVQSQVGYVPNRLLVRCIERMQGRPLTEADVPMRV